MPCEDRRGIASGLPTTGVAWKEPPERRPSDALDAAVLAAYGFSPKKDLLAQLLALNLEVARREEAGEPVTAPGIPPGYPDPARLVTEDCIRAE